MNVMVRNLVESRISQLQDEIDSRRDELHGLSESLKANTVTKDAAKRAHWSQTPEGRKRIAKNSRSAWRKRKAGKAGK